MLFLGISVVVGWGTHQYEKQLMDKVYQETSAQLSTQAAAFTSAVNRRLLLTEGLKAFVESELLQHHELESQMFDSYAASVFENINGILNLSVYPVGIAKYVFPLQGNESLMNRNLYESPNLDVRTNAERTKLIKQVTIVPPNTLIQGGVGIVSRQSVFLNNTFWGFVSVVIEMDPIYEEAQLSKAVLNLTVALRMNGNVFAGDPTLFDRSPVIQKVALQDGFWEIAALPSEDKFEAVTQTVSLVRIISFAALLGFLLFIYSQLAQKQRLTQLVEERTRNLQIANEEIELGYEELVASDETLREQYVLLTEQEQALRKSEERFREMLGHIDLASMMLDFEGNILFCNNYLLQLVGRENVELVAKEFKEIFLRTEQPAIPKLYETSVLTHDGALRIIQWHSSFGYDRDDCPIFIASIGEDITERKQSEEMIHHLAFKDQLTGLTNRAFFQIHIDELLSDAKQHDQKLALLFLDLDHFKMINDTLGHSVGDKLLSEVGARLTATVTENEVVSRLGGDEFTLIKCNIVDEHEVSEFSRKIISIFQQPFILNDQEYFVTASMGVAIYPENGDNSIMLLKNADMAMYKAKDQGKNSFQMFHDAMQINVEEQIIVSNSLRKALANDQFIMYYQPQMDTYSEQIVGLEALIRWQHPERGLVFPSDFISIAEANGLIVPIGEWVLRTVCMQIKEWQNQGLPCVKVAVNVSTRQFQQTDVAKTVRELLEETGVDPCYLEVEITENLAILDKNLVVLHELKEMGVTIAIDDFGTHYSSLSYLKRLPIHVIKIDRSFVNGISHDHKDETIISVMLLAAQNLNLAVVAEGVETKEQLHFLREHNCDTVQGYLFHKPKSAEEIKELLGKIEEESKEG